MPNLMYVNASPRGPKSESRALADEFLRIYQEADPSVSVEVLDLWSEPLPLYGGKGVEAKMDVFAGQDPSGAAGDAWDEVKALFETSRRSASSRIW
jgi:FMN-dependent NADH-azoreductase